MRVVRLNFVREQVEDFLVYRAWILTYVQKIVRIRFKAGNIHSVLKNPEFAFRIIMVGIFAHFEMVHILVRADCDCVILHSNITDGFGYCLPCQRVLKKLNSGGNK